MSRLQTPHSASQTLPHASRLNSHASHPRLRTPGMTNGDATDNATASNGGGGAVTDVVAGEDPRTMEFMQRYQAAEARLMGLFRARESQSNSVEQKMNAASATNAPESTTAKSSAPPKKPARAIDEDDYGDDDEDEDEPDVEPVVAISQTLAVINRRSPLTPIPAHLSKPSITRTNSNDIPKDTDEVRKKAEEDKEAAEEAAKQSFHTYFYTLENDRVAMLEQQRLDELDRQVEAETLGQQGTDHAALASAPQQGSLSSANLGASSLMLKHLLQRIDSKRNMVSANDAQLRRLISEVRKNRSKWASEEKVNQEELYEATEKVLFDLKAMTEYSAPFLQRVSKREAPDYYNIVKNPMDIGTMLKKLKTFQYKSRQEVVDDLHLIWNNCLKYNADPHHFLRKKALYMQKQTDKLVIHIPDLVVRDRAEVEAEERRNNLDAELDGMEDSEDEEPIMASRGRKAPSKSNKGSSNARKAPPALEGTPTTETKPNIKNQFLRADSDVPMENGFSTPPLPGTLTPMPNGIAAEAASQADASEADGLGNSVTELPVGLTEDPDLDDTEYKIWKQVTKKARATIATQRNRLFWGDRLNGDEPALLRTKAGMRQWMRQQRKVLGEEEQTAESATAEAGKDDAQVVSNETLAEVMEEEDDTLLPDYYDPLSAIPEIGEQLRWEEDTEGNVIMHSEETLRMLPPRHFNTPDGMLTKKMEANMRQMQETRKVCAKIGVVKQMQLQTQMYSNQFQKYEPTPFVEAGVEATVVSDDGPFMAPVVCRAAFQRSIAKIFYHAGFEDFQPSALDVVTDAAGQYFTNLVQSLALYAETSRIRENETSEVSDAAPPEHSAIFEENTLHALDENGIDIGSLESYVNDDVERLGVKLGVMHERMKAHLADLLRPALDPNQVGQDGVGAFNDDSEQFASGDFAEDIGEDFFGFKELGLDTEYGMTTLSVPFHLLHSRMRHAYQSTNTTTTSLGGEIMENPPPFEPVTIENIENEIGLVHNYFQAKLASNNDMPLIEDDDLPLKQRFPKPRLPPTGKISSPRKRPLREQQQMAKKKRKLDDGSKEDISRKLNGRLKLDMPPPTTETLGDPEKGEEAPGMMSPPESL